MSSGIGSSGLSDCLRRGRNDLYGSGCWERDLGSSGDAIRPSVTSISNSTSLGVIYTIDEVAEENQGVLNDIRASCGRFEDTWLPISPQEQRAVPVQIALHRLLPLLPPNLIHGTNPAQLVVADRTSPNSAIPRNWPLADVILERGEIGRRIQRHGGRYALLRQY